MCTKTQIYFTCIEAVISTFNIKHVKKNNIKTNNQIFAQFYRQGIPIIFIVNFFFFLNNINLFKFGNFFLITTRFKCRAAYLQKDDIWKKKI